MSIIIKTDTTIAAGTVLDIASSHQSPDIGFSYQTQSNVQAIFTNAGTVNFESSEKYVGGFVVKLNSGTGPRAAFVNDETGVFRVISDYSDSNGWTRGFTHGNTVINFNNAGLFEVISNNNSYGAYVLNTDFHFRNSGVMRVEGALTAYGARISYAQEIDNSGTIEVIGGFAAVGLYSERGWRLSNSGEITAATTAPGYASVAVFTELLDDTGRAFHNSGVLNADYAYYTINGDTDFATTIAARDTIHNSGTMNGAVFTAYGGDLVLNSGRINGAVLLGEGADIYEGSAGRTSGGVFGGFGADSLIGGARGDTLSGGEGSDALNGGGGGDLLDGGRGADALDGGRGMDTASYLNATMRVVVDLVAGTASSDRLDRLKSIERIIGSQYRDTMTGSDAAESFEGGAERDVLSGGGGADTLFGGADDDSLSGGEGRDVFIFTAGDDADVITDFLAGPSGDRIEIFGYAGFLDTQQVGADTLVTLSDTDLLLLRNVTASALTSENFTFDAEALSPGPQPSFWQTQTVTDSLSIRKGEVLQFLNPDSVYVDAILVEDTGFVTKTVRNDTLPSLFNAGAIRMVSTESSTSVYAIAQFSSTENRVSNTASGLIEVISSDFGDATALLMPGARIWNAGEIRASAIWGAATGVSGSDFINDGTVIATAATRAIGYEANGSENRFWNSGDIIVDGGSQSLGVKFTASYGSFFVNEGDIRVTDRTTSVDSTGLYYSSHYLGLDLFNEGLIEADYAVRQFIHTTGDGSYVDRLYNSGELRGQVAMTVGRDYLYNFGLITGKVALGSDFDLFDGRTGVQAAGVFGEAGNDLLIGGDGADYLDGGQNNDTLAGAGGVDTLVGGSGNDTFHVEAGIGADVISDFVAGGSDDVIRVSGYAGYQSLQQIGADVRIVFSDTDSLLLEGVSAGALTEADFIFSAAPLDPTPTAPTPKAPPKPPGGPNDPAAAFIIKGQPGADVLKGDEQANLIDALGGKDRINGFGGDDEILAGDGDDTLDGGAGDDGLMGGWGADLFIHRAGEGMTVLHDFNPGEGDILRLYGVSDSRMAYIIESSTVRLLDGSEVRITEDLIGVDGIAPFIELYGSGDADELSGTADPNSIFGLGGNDVIKGYYGEDRLEGGDGNDLIDGEGEKDTLVGGKGTDTLTGGYSEDTFIYLGIGDSRKLGSADLITDLTKVDVIDLSVIDADTNQSGDQAFTLVMNLSGAAGEIALSYDETTARTLLLADIDGDGEADMIIRIDGDRTNFDNFVL